ncbi:eukaryotic translation initiation factor 3 subunit e [Holotrichia oblita]|uniref:Eukaryotic translation initiation factor 3 subunit e n=1 Tax=Holotrichia oblita TaxID=644536 RepID=A0ACB9TYS8_HOLOL|nr:eukaryotic translation initiation factor 3 subunit e [Holotrichia oblita]
MAKFDLTSRMGQYLDRHLVFPLLEFLSAKEIYDEQELLKAKLDILSKTNMVDYAIDIRKQLYPKEDVPEELKERRVHVVTQLQELQHEVEPILQLMGDDEVMKNMENMRDSKTLINFLSKEYGFEIEMIESLHKLAKYRYECGNYSNWDSALEDLNKLREYIDSNHFAGNSLQLLQQRTWLIHWSLFVFFNHALGRELIIEMFLYRPHYLNAIQTMCPHILRYLATAVIINRGRRSALKDLVKVIQQESYTYRDPITEFVEHLYVNFDFDGARQKLHECQIVLFNDFFLISCLDEFVENARLMIFETFCRIHQCISIGMLAEKLNMNPDEAEYRLKLGHVVMGAQPLSPYQQLIEKVDSLAVRSETLVGLIDRKLKARTDIRWGAQEF